MFSDRGPRRVPSSDTNHPRAADDAEKGPSKSELKKRAKEAEKAKKAAEKAARQAELDAQKAAAEVVRIPAFSGRPT